MLGFLVLAETWMLGFSGTRGADFGGLSLGCGGGGGRCWNSLPREAGLWDSLPWGSQLPLVSAGEGGDRQGLDIKAFWGAWTPELSFHSE